MAKKLATIAVLGVICALLVDATHASAAPNPAAKQAVAACKSERKADPAAFKSQHGIGAKKRAAFAHCVASKLAPQADQILSQLPQLPSTLPPQACAALNTALGQVSGLDFSALLGQLGAVQIPPLPGVPPQLVQQLTQELAQLQGLLTQLQAMLPAQLAFLQGLFQGQLNQLVAQLQAQLATVCPPTTP